jgi:UDP-hydrolysing UDP-N-acetyl-D-glucosamine 2-epimerase
VELKILCSASALLDRYGRVVDLIRADGFDVVDELYTVVEGNEPINMALTTASTIQQSALLLKRLNPDQVVTIADRYETLGTAIAAAYLGLRLIHIQGGELSGNIDEKVRHAVTKLANLHLVSNEHARNRLLRMGEQPAAVHVTGCPSVDLAREALELPLQDVQHAVNTSGVGDAPDLKQDYAVVLQHPETDSFDQSYGRMEMTLKAAKSLGLPALVFWPNVDAGADATSKAIRVFRETHEVSNFRYIKNLEGHLFLRLLAGARCLIGNSSVGIRECAFLGTPVVNVGDRQMGRERGPNTLDCEWNLSEILRSADKQASAGRYKRSFIYGDGFAGEKVARIVRTTSISPVKHFYDQ